VIDLSSYFLILKFGFLKLLSVNKTYFLSRVTTGQGRRREAKERRERGLVNFLRFHSHKHNI